MTRHSTEHVTGGDLLAMANVGPAVVGYLDQAGGGPRQPWWEYTPERKRALG